MRRHVTCPDAAAELARHREIKEAQERLDVVEVPDCGERLRKRRLGERYFFESSSCATTTAPLDLVVFLHGSRDIALMQALEDTDLLAETRRRGFVVAFGQCRGEIEDPHPDERFGQLCFGEIYWGIKASEGASEDVDYVAALVADVQGRIAIRRTHVVGHSNGGVFALLLALALPGLFASVVSHQGGLGWDPECVLDFDAADAAAAVGDRCAAARPRLLFYTGEHDEYRLPCQNGHALFQAEGFDSTLVVEPGLAHCYDFGCEPLLLDWMGLGPVVVCDSAEQS
jgi:poly(3-hydroxybutyrate) depolymerase